MAKNTETFKNFSPISNIPRRYIFTSSDDYIFDIRELQTYVNLTTNGLLKNPYTNIEFTLSDQHAILKKCSDLKLHLINYEVVQNRNLISDITILHIAELAIKLSEDYDEKNGFKAATDAVSMFVSYYDQLQTNEKTALSNVLVLWNKSALENANPIRTVSKFSDMLTSLTENGICLHVAAVYFWVASKKLNEVLINSVYENLPEKIKFTSEFLGGMIPENQESTVHLYNTQYHICSEFDSYISWWKLSIFGHHNDKVARQTKQSIFEAKSESEIKNILDTQDKPYSNSNDEVQSGGYHETIKRSLNYLRK